MKKDDKNGASFIPCGDALEKMEEILDDALEDVSGGSLPSHAANDSDYIEDEAMLIIPIV